MVGGSRRAFVNGDEHENGKVNGNGHLHKKKTSDLERGTGNDARARFRDVVDSVIQDGRRDKMKRLLIDGIQDDMEIYRKSDEELKQIKNKKIRKFYQKQNDQLDDWREVDLFVEYIADDVINSMDPIDRDGDGLPERLGGLNESGEQVEAFLPVEEQDRRRSAKRKERIAILVNVVANIFLLAGKIAAAFSSSSLSLLASLADSALDLLCTLIVWSTSKIVQWKITGLSKRFPIGRRRLEPIGILVFSVIMIVSFLQILQESVKKVMPGASHEAATLPLIAILAMGATVLVKGIIWIGCYSIKTTQVQALAQDCKTDVVFNTLSLAFPLIGRAANIWWLDAVGAGILSLFIIYDWASTCLENVGRLTGVAVDERLLKKVTFVSCSPSIR